MEQAGSPEDLWLTGRNSLLGSVRLREAKRNYSERKKPARVYFIARSSSRSRASERSCLRLQRSNHNSASSDKCHSSLRRRLAALEYSIVIFSPRLLTLIK